MLVSMLEGGGHEMGSIHLEVSHAFEVFVTLVFYFLDLRPEDVNVLSIVLNFT